MIAEVYLRFFERDVLKLKEEITLYRHEPDLWKVQGGVKNPAGNLALHITGNLKHFIGAVLGKTGYVRERDKEFSEKKIPRAQLLAGLDEALEVVRRVLLSISDKAMLENFPIEFIKGQGPTSTLQVLTQLIAHLDYHLGQVNYHRRLLSL